MKTKRANGLSSAIMAAMIADLPKPKVYDQSAFTISELSKASGRPVSELKKVCSDNVASGKWEMVMKRYSKGAYPAYRKTRK